MMCPEDYAWRKGRMNYLNTFSRPAKVIMLCAPPVMTAQAQPFCYTVPREQSASTSHHCMRSIAWDHPYALEASTDDSRRADEKLKQVKKKLHNLYIGLTRRRLKQKVATLKDTLKLRRERSSESVIETLESYISGVKLDLLKRDINSRDGEHGEGHGYSPEIRTFAIYLYCCSRKAYKYVSSFFSLPSTRTVQRWLAVTNPPEFTRDALDTTTARSSPHGDSLTRLKIGGRSIRKQVDSNRTSYFGMRYVAAYLLAVLGGNQSPSAKDIRKILETVAVSVEDEPLNKVIQELSGKNIDEVIYEGQSMLASVPTGGVAAAAGGGGGGEAGGAAAAEKEEEKKEESEEESDDDMGFGLFD